MVVYAIHLLRMFIDLIPYLHTMQEMGQQVHQGAAREWVNTPTCMHHFNIHTYIIHMYRHTCIGHDS